MSRTECHELTVVSNNGQSVALGFSLFCPLFTENDWEAFEYVLGMLSYLIKHSHPWCSF